MATASPAGAQFVCSGTGAEAGSGDGGSTVSSSGTVACGAGAQAADNLATALGSASTAQYAGTAVGNASNVASQFGTAVGSSSSADYGGTAVGYQSSSSGSVSTALGIAAAASGYASLAGGVASAASGSYAIALGTYATASGSDSATAIGANTQALGDHAIAIGGNLASGPGGAAYANAANAVAIGNQTQVGAASGTAVGFNNALDASSTNASAFGTGNTIKGANSGAFGSGNSVTGTGSYVVGDPNTVNGNGSFVLGDNNQINTGTGAGAGTAGFGNTINVVGSTNTVANTASGAGSNLLGNGNTVGAQNASVIGNGSTVTGANAVAIGGGNAVAGANSIAIGQGAGDNGVGGSTVIGQAASVAAGLTGSNVALGQNALAARGALANYAAPFVSGAQSSAGEVSVGTAAVGGQRQITNVAPGTQDTDAVNVEQLRGAVAITDALGTTTASSIGGGATYAAATGITGLGYSLNGSSAVYTNVVSGQQALASGAAGPVRYATPGLVSNALDLAGAGGPVTLGNVAPGAVTSTSRQAVNGGQLYGTAASVASALGGGSTVNTDGSVSAPSYALSGSSAVYTNVVSGQQALASGAAGPVQYATPGLVSNALNLVGAGGPVMFGNVAPGAVTSTSLQAVNGSQLYGTAASVASALGGGSTVNANGSVGAPSYAVGGKSFNNVGAALDAVQTNAQNGLTNLQSDTRRGFRRVNGGVAAAMAATGIRLDTRPGKISTGVGVAGWAGEAGVAGGVGYTTLDQRWQMNAALTVAPSSGGHTDVGAVGGLSFTWN